jgi:transposase InsO family protein
MAVARRQPGPGLVHHSDQGSQPEFKQSSQRRRFTERIVVPQPRLYDRVMGGGCASVIAEAA